MSIRARFVGTALIAMAAALPQAARASSVDYALLTQGASFVSASSYLQYAVNQMPNPALALQTMENDLLTPTPLPWYSDGDTRYIFNQGDTNQWIEISLGQVRDVNSIGASMMLPYMDRYVLGPFSIQTSVDGTSWSNWGSVNISSSSTNPVLIGGAFTDVEYIRYYFGPFGPDWGGGSAAVQLFADATPLPPAWTLMLVGLAFFGLIAKRTRQQEPAAAAA